MSLPNLTPESFVNQAARSRSRVACGLAVAAVICLGLASRRFPGLFPSVLGKYPGDSLWTLMVLCGWAFVLPRHAPWRLAVYALAISFAVEFFQLYQAPWAVAIRSTTLGRLALGTTFGWMDLLAYAAGAVVGLAIDVFLGRLKRHTRQRPDLAATPAPGA